MIGTGPLPSSHIKGIPHCHKSQTLHSEKFDTAEDAFLGSHHNHRQEINGTPQYRHCTSHGMGILLVQGMLEDITALYYYKLHTHIATFVTTKRDRSVASPSD